MSLLCGFWGSPDEDRLRGMAQRLRHRCTGEVREYRFGDSLQVAFGPDACANSLSGVAFDEEVFIALVGMPRHPGCRDIDELLSEVRKLGIKILDDLRGPFVGVLVHSGQRYLFRDRSGRRALYYSEIGGRDHFSIESRALYQVADYSPELLPSSIAQYLAFSFVPGGNTMLRGIREVPAGCYLKQNFSEPERYFFPEQLEGKEERSKKEWIQIFDKAFQESIENTTPPGMAESHVFLSGGIDSSIVTAALKEKRGSGNVQAHAIHFGENYPNELPFIREAANYCGVDCEEVEINPKSFLPTLHDVVDSLNDPIGDPVAMPNFLLARHVRNQGVEAVFNGEGGDPLFGGPKNMTMLLHHWYGDAKEVNHREKPI